MSSLFRNGAYLGDSAAVAELFKKGAYLGGSAAVADGGVEVPGDVQVCAGVIELSELGLDGADAVASIDDAGPVSQVLGDVQCPTVAGKRLL